MERREPLRDEVLVRREVIVGQRFPVGQQRDGKARREPRQLVGEPLRGQRVGGDDREQAPFAGAGGGELREREGVGRARRAPPRGTSGRRRANAGRAGAAPRASGWSRRERRSRARRRCCPMRTPWRWSEPRLPQPPARRRDWPAARATANRARIIRGSAQAPAGRVGPLRRADIALMPEFGVRYVITARFADPTDGANRRGSDPDLRKACDGRREPMMPDIGNAERVALMQRLVALQVEHRDLDVGDPPARARSGARPAAADAVEAPQAAAQGSDRVARAADRSGRLRLTLRCQALARTCRRSGRCRPRRDSRRTGPRSSPAARSPDSRADASSRPGCTSSRWR